ncbi:GLPGLI family protein [Flavobacterium sp.]|uniref:GLPGLI family protein n=1 Tax=Flavobacterium sp. TaxID=239 RepID=UPI0040484154
MKYFYLIFITNLIIAQNSTIKYVARQIQESEFQKKLPTETRRALEVADELINEIKIELVFNDSISVFKLEDGYYPSTYEEKIATTKAGLSVPKYMDLNQNKSFFNNRGNPIVDEKEFLVYDTLDFKWEILNEEKKIDNFTVIKAIGIANKNERKVNVIAWFAPELPFRHGPFGIGNLPGIILEMQIGTIHYVTKEININNNNKNIEIPKKGRIVSIEEYYKILKDRYEDFKR